jgi:serine/threonine-protein kinase
MQAADNLEARAGRRVGSVLRGKYRIDRLLGVGATTVVYAATHRNQKQVAIKMLHPELSARQDVRQVFLRDGYAANSVKHPGAVAVLDDDTADDGTAFLVMELLDGVTLERLRESWGGKIPAQPVLALGFQLLDVLAAAHKRGIVHRDIRPGHVFLEYDGSLKVLDFGLARVRDLASNGSNVAPAGAPGFMAPEQALGKAHSVDAQTDVWAAGATLFAVLSGQRVQEGESNAEIVVKSATVQARSLRDVAPEVPPRVVTVVDRAIGFDKSERWPSAGDMRDAIASTHQAIYGGPFPENALATLVAAAGPRHVATLRPPPFESGPPPRNVPNTARIVVRVPTAATAPAAAASPAARAAPAVVASTLRMAPAPAPAPAPAVAAGRAVSAPPPSRRRPQSTALVAAISVAVAMSFVALASVFVLAIRAPAPTGPSQAVAPTQPSAASSTSPRAVPSTSTSTSAEPPPSATASSPPAAAASSLETASPPPSASATASTGARRWANGPPAATLHPGAGCNPPFFVDAAGRKIPKPGCAPKPAPTIDDGI